MLLLASCGSGSPEINSLEPASKIALNYGADDGQRFGQLSIPEETTERVPLVVLVHGGYWREGFGLDLMEDLGDDLLARGYAVWNIEYRRVGSAQGGFPGTLVDVAESVDVWHLFADDFAVDLDRVVVVGHSAGGHLALWNNSRRAEGPATVTNAVQVEPILTIGLAAVVDLARAEAEGLGSDAVQAFIGGSSDEFGEEYLAAQPVLDAPGASPVLLIHGTDDRLVPVSQSAAFEGHENVEVILVDGENHFDAIDPASRIWNAAVDAIDGATNS